MKNREIIYKDSKRIVTKDELQSETNPHGAVRYSQCDNKYCKREAHYLIRGLVSGVILHVCDKHMKTMAYETVKPQARRMEQLGLLTNRILASAFK